MTLLLPVLTAALSMLLSASAKSGEQGKSVAADLQGKWVLCEPILKLCDEELPLGAMTEKTPLFAIVKDGAFTLTYAGIPRDLTFGFEADPAKSPMRLDLTDMIDDGEGGKLPLKCIYRITGSSLIVSFYWERLEHLRVSRPANFEGQESPRVTLRFKKVAD